MLTLLKHGLQHARLSKLGLMASLLCLSIPLQTLQADAFGWHDMKQATKSTMHATVNTVKKPFNKKPETIELRQTPTSYTSTPQNNANTLPPLNNQALNQNTSSQNTGHHTTDHYTRGSQGATQSPSQNPSTSVQSSSPAYGASLDASIQLYREGKYVEAEKMLSTLHKHSPESTRTTYYLAITEAQLGRVAMARKHYEEVILLDPNGDTARLSEIGLRHLPHSSQKLDPPPKLSTAFKKKTNTPTHAQPDHTRQYTTAAPVNNTASSSTPTYSNLPQPIAQSVTATEASRQVQSARSNTHSNASSQTTNLNTNQYNNSQSNTPANAMSPMMSPEMQQLMMMQTMMGGMGSYPGSNAASGMNNNPMATMMMMQSMQQQGPGQNTQNGRNAPAMDPQFMSDMMMNQMLQNFNFGGDTKDR